jgi:hypothetical protein
MTRSNCHDLYLHVLTSTPFKNYNMENFKSNDGRSYTT